MHISLITIIRRALLLCNYDTRFFFLFPITFSSYVVLVNDVMFAPGSSSWGGGGGVRATGYWIGRCCFSQDLELGPPDHGLHKVKVPGHGRLVSRQ